MNDHMVSMQGALVENYKKFSFQARYITAQTWHC